MSTTNKTGTLWGFLLSLLAVASTAVGAGLGVLLIHGDASATLVVGAETGSGGGIILLYLASRRRLPQFDRETFRILANFWAISIGTNIGFVLTLGAIADGGFTQGLLSICELTGTLLITTIQPVIRRHMHALIAFAVLAVLGVMIYVDPFGGTTSFAVQGLVGALLVGLGMGLRIEYASRLPRRQADFGKQGGAFLAGLCIVAWSLFHDGFPSIPDSFGNEVIGTVDLSMLPAWAGIAFLVVGVTLCGVLTTGLPAALENAATNWAPSNTVAIAHTMAPFIALPVDLFVHGLSVQMTTFTLGAVLVCTGAFGSVWYTERWEWLGKKVDGALRGKIRRPDFRAVGAAERAAQEARARLVTLDLEKLVREHTNACGQLAAIRDQVTVNMRRLENPSTARRAAARLEELRDKAVGLDSKIRRLDHQIEELRASALRRVRGTTSVLDRFRPAGRRTPAHTAG